MAKKKWEWEKLNDVKLADIIEYCKENDEVAWLKEITLAEGKVNKKGEPRKTSFIEVRNEFARKFFPDLAPKRMAKKESMYDIISKL